MTDSQVITKCHKCTAADSEVCNKDPRLCGKGEEEKEGEEQDE